MLTPKIMVESRVSQVLAASPALRDAAIAESGIVELLTLAASEQDRNDRWQRYEDLKCAGRQFVGWRAQQQKLRSPAMYEAFLDAIDTLLPEPFEEEEKTNA